MGVWNQCWGLGTGGIITRGPSNCSPGTKNVRELGARQGAVWGFSPVLSVTVVTNKASVR